MASKEKRLVAAEEENRLTRSVLAWLSLCPKTPYGVVEYEIHSKNSHGMVLTVIQSAYIVKQYICGGYTAELQFAIKYRVKPGNKIDERLQADELLNEVGEWATQNKPTIDGLSVRKVEVTARAALLAAYDDGDEDHQILMKLTYEVS